MVERVKAALVRKGYSFSEIQAAVQRYWGEQSPENSRNFYRWCVQRKSWGWRLGGCAKEKELSGGAAQTTNNRMELTGVIMALSALKEPCHIVLTTDSKYVVDSITKGWVYGWQKRGWVKADKKPA